MTQTMRSEMVQYDTIKFDLLYYGIYSWSLIDLFMCMADFSGIALVMQNSLPELKYFQSVWPIKVKYSTQTGD